MAFIQWFKDFSVDGFGNTLALEGLTLKKDMLKDLRNSKLIGLQ